MSLLHANYTSLYKNNLSSGSLSGYLKDYDCILLPYDPLSCSTDIVNWVSAGHTLIIFDTNGNGYFSNLFSNSSAFSITNFGSGKILYINSSLFINRYDLLSSNILEVVAKELALNQSLPTIPFVPDFSSAYGNIQINGSLWVNTNDLILQGRLNELPFPFNHSNNIEIFGNINLQFSNASLTLFPSQSMLMIKSQTSLNVLITVTNSGSTYLISNGINVYNLTKSLSENFNITGVSIYARMPSINASGTIIFDELDVHSSLYVPLAGIVQEPAEIIGTLKFNTYFINDPVIIFSEFSAQGNAINLAAAQISRPVIQWIAILASPFNIIFNVLFCVFITIYFARKRIQS